MADGAAHAAKMGAACYPCGEEDGAVPRDTALRLATSTNSKKIPDLGIELMSTLHRVDNISEVGHGSGFFAERQQPGGEHSSLARRHEAC